MKLFSKHLTVLLCVGLAFLAAPLHGAALSAAFNSASTVPHTAASYTATGNTVNFSLNFAPPTGTDLTVVNNTGLALIQGTFDNLAQGQRVYLSFGGIDYPFVADYFGGTGNDLTLHWANRRLLAWGSNTSGQLGDSSTTDRQSPVAVQMGGVLADKVPLELAGGNSHALLVCSDGTLASWGSKSSGQLGTTASPSNVPVLVDRGGVLFQPWPIKIATGYDHSLVLCTDSTMAAWGSNSYDQLGNDSFSVSQSTAPIFVNRAGALTGKTPVAVAAGKQHNLVLCSDGSLAGWGSNSYGQLGNGTNTDSSLPVEVNLSGVLNGKTITAIAAGGNSSMVLCSDGTLATWGRGNLGMLGNGGSSHSNVPVLVNSSGALFRRSVTAIACGGSHMVVLCSDGTLAAWGYNTDGQLGNGSTNQSYVPVRVNRSGVLSGKTVIGLAAGDYHSLAWCSDGTMAGWGSNANGRLGNNSTTNSSTPVLVNSSALRAGERIIAAAAGGTSSYAIVAVPPAPQVTTLAATSVADGFATLNASVDAEGGSATVSFEYGLTTAYGSTVMATPSALTGNAATTVSANLTRLVPGTTYHFRVVATSAGGTVKGADQSFTTGTLATLAGLAASEGTLSPAFDPRVTRYSLAVASGTTSLTVKPVAASAQATIAVNGTPVASGSSSQPLPLTTGNNTVTIAVNAGAGNLLPYTLTVTRLPASFAFASASSTPVTVESFVADGFEIAIALDFAPQPGTTLTLVKNTGGHPIQGTFENLSQGQRIDLTYGGMTYAWVADYFGGDGNDLVLQWANQRILAWGTNTTGQLGDGTEAARAVPSPTDPEALLAGTAIRSVSAGTGFSVALLVDGRMAAWGINDVGQLGNGGKVNSNRPVWVDTEGVLEGKTVVKVACGVKHTLALCTDGTLAAWGYGSDGQLGYGGRDSSAVPVRVDQSGVLAGKSIVGLAAGANHSLVLCSDGTLVTWGSNFDYTWGSPSTVSPKPRLVEPGGYLDGRTLVEISAGSDFNSARSSDGTLFTWGLDNSGSLGYFLSYSIPIHSPRALDATGALSGRSAVALSSNGRSSLALCNDGRMVQWGGSSGSYGNVSLVNASGVLSGRSVEEIACAPQARLVRCGDNTLVHWQYASFELGAPALVNLAELKSSERLGPIAAGNDHFLVLVNSPPAPQAVTLAATDISDTRAVLHAAVRPNGGDSTVVFEYGPTPAYGQTVVATPGLASGTGEAQVSAVIDGLVSGTTYHFRVIATGNGGTARGDRVTFSTTDFTSLAGLSLSHGTVHPTFDSRVTGYHVVVPSGIESITFTPQTKEAASTVRVAGLPVASGNASAPQPLAVGNNPIEIEVTAPGGGNSTIYQVTVTRLPAQVLLDGSGEPSLVVESLAPAGNPLPIALGYKPITGTHFIIAKVNGPSAINGTFAGLEQGQTITLADDGVGYDYIVNYHGGDGNDLVLQWAHTRPIAWGNNFSGQLGVGSSGSGTRSAVPVPVNRSGILAGKTVIALAAGRSHSLAMCADGTLASWGEAFPGILGRGPDISSSLSSSVPVPVYQDGVLAHRRVVGIAAGAEHSFALCADGSLAAWGDGSSGQMADGAANFINSSPLIVNQTGVLANRRTVELRISRNTSFAVLDDGRVAAWGSASNGILGTGNNLSSYLPVLVNHGGALYGKRVISCAAGFSAALALCDDGSLVVWGTNSEGQFGNGSTASAVSLPVLMEPAGALIGKTVVEIAAGDYYFLALCSDGTLAAWGLNGGRLGDGSAGRQTIPVAVDRSGVLAGKKVVKITASGSYSTALCSDGTVAYWGAILSIGISSKLPAALDLSGLAPGERVVDLDVSANHGLAIVAMPPPPRQVETLAANSVTDTTAILRGRASGNGSTATVRFEYGTTPALGNALIAQAGEITGISLAEVSANIAGLQPGTTYHYRVVAKNAYGSVAGEILTFTTTRLADLTGLSLDRGSVTPAFSPNRLSYDVTLPADAGEIRITPTALDSAASVTVAGIPAAPDVVVPLSSAATTIPVTVTSADLLNTRPYQITVTRLPLTLDLAAVPQSVIRAGGFSIGGNSPVLSLGNAPVPGASLPILENAGIGFIAGRFDNLAQGQTVYLAHGSIDYPYVVNYYGGSGNDLVLEWANTRLFAWGANSYGQLGDGTSTTRLLPTPVDATGTLAGRTIIGGGCGEEHSVAVTADGGLFAWGRNLSGQLGTGAGNTRQLRPVAVMQTGALADKRVVALSVGRYHTLALCDDGTVFGWGANSNSQLGDGSTTDRNVPVATSMTGALAGKRVVAISAGSFHSLALCDDGALAAWGYNNSGQLGNGATANSPLPVAVDQTGILLGKQVVAVAAGHTSSYALCSDGTVASWGGNGGGQLGDGTKVARSTPVWIRNDGVLAGKQVVALAAGIEHALAMCSDGTLAAWGNNSSGSLGTGNTTNSDIPVLVNRSGVLAGKVVRTIHAASYRSFAMCDDGTLAAWGNNGSGALGNNSSGQSNTPAAASMANLLPGEQMVRPLTGAYTQSNLAIVTSPLVPRATTLAAGSIGDNRAVLHGSANANGQSAALSFEYGPTASYGFTVAASPASVEGTGATAVSAILTDLLPGRSYHFRVMATGSFGVVRGENQTFTTSTLATLATLGLEGAQTEPSFHPLSANYRAVVSSAAASIRVTPVAAHADAAIEVNGITVASGNSSAPIALAPGENEILITVKAAGDVSRMDYRVTVTRVTDSFVFRSAGDVGMYVPFFSGAGMNASFALEYTPAPGTNLRVIEQSGIRPVQAAFDNLAHGQEVMLNHQGMSYRFVANYFGGDGNDLVLHWADTVLNAWGRNQEWQIGNASATNAVLPAPVHLSGVLAGKTVTAVVSGYRHSLALCSDGTLAAWGQNSEGQLGDGTTTSRSVPVLVNQSGVLAGRTVVAIAAADYHSLALCSDGSLFSWGSNEMGRLGNGGSANSPLPVPVTSTGALAGKRPVAIACAGSTSLVLCEDGALVSWGSNSGSMLGVADFTNSWSDVPRLVDASGVLAGRQVVRISVGSSHMLALCSDGSLVAWGNHQSDLWGNGNTTRSVPTLVPATGLFAGRKIVDISLGANHSLVLCDDQTIIAWGNNSNGRLGNNSTTSPGIPVLVDRTGVLAARQVVRVIARDSHSLAVCADGTVAAWGLNSSGQLGNGGTSQSLVPSLVSLGVDSAAAVTVAISNGVGGHSLRIAGAPPAPLVATLDAADIADISATLRAEVTTNGGVASVSFQYGTTTAYGLTVSATPVEVSGNSMVAVGAALNGLLPDTTYHYRVVATKGGVIRFGENRSFTTTSESTLAGLSIVNAVLTPEFSKQRFLYHATVPFDTTATRVTPVASQTEAVVRIKGSPVPSGEASAPLPLAVGNNDISVTVTSGDGTKSSLYRIAVTRLPGAFVIDSPNHAPITAETLVASGLSIPIQLNHAPRIGAEFTLVKMTGNEPIAGHFVNLVQGQTIWLRHGDINYPFVVDYRGGTGFDLVLHWGNHSAIAWGLNTGMQLGDMTSTDRGAPVEVAIPHGALRQLAAGDSHSLALYADGTMLSWGSSGNGRLGRESSAGGNPPGPVDATGALAGKHITSIAVGFSFNLALADDGTLYSWGSNTVGQLGDGGITDRTTPVAVRSTGMLASRRVQAIAVGSSHALALCSDGTLAAWGQNSSGQLGNGSTNHAAAPVAVINTGALAGKQVVQIAAGPNHSLALCSDGTLLGWGSNDNGQLGTGNTTSSSVPVVVPPSGVLAGKTIAAVSAGSSHTLVLTSDGTLAAWGQGSFGRLGNGANNNSSVPVAVVQSGVLAGKTVVGIAAGNSSNLAWCADGTLVSWGRNIYGMLGNNSTTDSNVPVLVDLSGLPDGQVPATAVVASSHNLAMVAMPPLAQVETLAADSIIDTGATLHARADRNGSPATLSFEYGLTTEYGSTIAATPSTLTANGQTDVSAVLNGLMPGTTYHFRAVATGAGGTVRGGDRTFTTSSLASLAGLTTDAGPLSPAVDPRQSEYVLTVPHFTAAISITANLVEPSSTLTIQGQPAAPGAAAGPFDLSVGAQVIPMVVTTADASISQTYQLTVVRLPATIALNSPFQPVFAVPALAADGVTLPVALNHAPATGATLRLIDNTGTSAIFGRFVGMPQAGQVVLNHGGIDYHFVANYHGGDGNDLVLDWANNRVLAWGNGDSGQVGDGLTQRRYEPVSVDAAGALAGRTVIALSSGGDHSLALCADGKVVSWGLNTSGQLGNGTQGSSSIPTDVDANGVLAGKHVSAISAGGSHSLALCSDGTLVTWGSNSSGQLGDGTTTSRQTPVEVIRSGALAGKTVAAISAGSSHNLVLCADGTVAAWGANGSGQLGVHAMAMNSPLPKQIDMTVVHGNSPVIAVAAGGAFSLALDAAGVVSSWGYNSSGQLGDGTNTLRTKPVPVVRSGALAGRKVTAIQVGNGHAIVLCEDGMMAAWGRNSVGQLGDGGTTQRNSPVFVDRSGTLSGKSIGAIRSGRSHNYALATDGTLLGWGANSFGQLADGTSTSRQKVILMASNALPSGGRFISVMGGSSSNHGLALVAMPPAPRVETLAASQVGDTAATLNAAVSGQGNMASVVFEYGLTPAYGFKIAASPSQVEGIATVAASARVTGLLAGTSYHFRVVATGPGGTVTGEDRTFTAGVGSALAGLEILPGSLDPAFVLSRGDYLATVPSGTESIAVRPTAATAGAVIRVNGTIVTSGANSPPIPLETGENEIPVVVTSVDGVESLTYRVTVLRLPAEFAFSSLDDGAVQVGGLTAQGDLPPVRLLVPPPAGANLTLIRQSASQPISGRFDNLDHGERILLEHNGVFYSFVANYFGGDGNDLVLHWANTRPFAFGSNNQGQLGNGTFTNSPLPVAVQTGTALRGRTVLALSAGRLQNLAVLDDGSVASWGYNESGILGDGSTTSRSTPVSVDREGVFAGRVVVSVAAGNGHNMALCADGTVATWGGNYYGQLGDGTRASSALPLMVNESGVLARQRVIAIAAGDNHSLALCSDGRVAAWGKNDKGQLGSNVVTLTERPVWVDHSGVLAGKTVVAIAAGFKHSIALCSDGTLAAWGANDRHQLGDNGTFNSTIPVRVRQGDRAGKSVAAIRADALHNFALCSDGTIVAWGGNTNGRLGIGGSTDARVPTRVATGKPAIDVDAGDAHSLAVFSDGTAAAWGLNNQGRLGNGGTSASELPVAVAAGAMPLDSRAIAASAGENYSVILAALPPAPLANTLDATARRDRSATLNGTVFANGPDATVWFELGTEPDFLDRILPGTPAQATGGTTTHVMASATSLLPGTTYHYRMVAANERGETPGEIRTFTTSSLTTLSGLLPSQGVLGPQFSPTRPDYLISLSHATDSLVLTPTATHTGSSITVNGAPVASGSASPPITLESGDTEIDIEVTSADGLETSVYQVKATRLPASLTLGSVTDSLLTADSLSASGIGLEFGLGFTPAPGTRLRLLTLTGPAPLIGRFSNLAHGEIVGVDHGGSTYHFVVNYYGGNGNDLELRWLNSRLVAWGGNFDGQLGNNSTTTSKVPVPVDMSGVLNRRPVIQVVGNNSDSSPFANYSMALCADGTLAGWGRRQIDLSRFSDPNSRIPLAMETGGALSGKSLASISAGSNFSLMLADDGTLAATGYNGYFKLGNGSAVPARVPVVVQTRGALRGKRVVAVSAGVNHSLALCSDGTVVAWGSNQSGELGIEEVTSSMVPVLVRGLPADQNVVAISAGRSFSLALLDDGRIFAWGANGNGQLGMGGTEYQNQSSPVPVDRSGVLAGKRIIAISAGAIHSLALSDEGLVYAWGSGYNGRLGNGGTSTSPAPVEVYRGGLLNSRHVTAISATRYVSLALCSDGTLAVWGDDIGAMSPRPIAISRQTLRPGELFMDIVTGSDAGHAVAMTALPLPATEALPASEITGVSATLHGVVNARGNDAVIRIEYGLDENSGTMLTATPGVASGDVDTAVSVDIAGLKPGTPYYYRIVAESYGGIVRSPTATFTTLSDNAQLAALNVSGSVLGPEFEKTIEHYVATVPNATTAVTVTPMTDHLGARVLVDGVPVASGSASSPIGLEVGNQTITVFITAEDGITTKTYTITVTRLPEQFVFNAETDTPVTADGFTGGGVPIDIVLNYAPTPGTVFTLVNNTSLSFIYRMFGNLVQGQHVTLSYGGKDYDFVANYFGGTGNDLVLQWAATKALAWGLNTYGQVGDDSTTGRLVPTRVDDTGALSGKILTAVSGGYLHSLALCSDGTVAAWGYNVHGQLGDGGSAQSSVPVEVDRTGVLAGKTMIAVSAGPFHNLALCSDGTIAAWGYNNYGQLGNGGMETSRVPVLVNPVGALAGKHVVAVAAGAYHSFALCDDGTVAGWGYNDEGELGDGTATTGMIPVAVDVSGVLAGKRVSFISAGQYHALALCTDGTLVAWGYNNRGQLGDGTTATSGVPVEIGNNGELAGKNVVSISAGKTHSMALCADGTLASWGYNHRGQLATGSTAQSLLPVAADLSGFASPAGLAAGSNHGLIRFTDGSLAAWGDNAKGQLGDGSNAPHGVPSVVNVDSLGADTRFMMAVAGGSAANHSLAVVALPELDAATREIWIQDPQISALAAEVDLIRHAFGIAPGEDMARKLPRPGWVGDRFEVSFSEPAEVSGVVYGAEWSRTLLPGSWHDVPDTGSGAGHIFTLPADAGPRVFMRLKVTRP